MRAVVQRVSHSKVEVHNAVVGEIEAGLMVLLGVGREDDLEDAEYLVEKILNLRIFEDEAGKMNRSLLDIEGELMVISQFTLYGDTRKGRRPSFVAAAPPEKGEALYEEFVQKAQEAGIRVATGRFKHHMMVHLINDGPVTILIDSKKEF
ncbi:MAG: D-tyrosyl-tRNA(Tyr) deacylase [delta proteobacterium ML8_F1]|nr:MAG: D-tyrosyl-tRNA(Tyr) deacylase [delta proteobacterium ML8_F1]